MSQALLIPYILGRFEPIARTFVLLRMNIYLDLFYFLNRVMFFLSLMITSQMYRDKISLLLFDVVALLYLQKRHH